MRVTDIYVYYIFSVNSWFWVKSKSIFIDVHHLTFDGSTIALKLCAYGPKQKKKKWKSTPFSETTLVDRSVAASIH